MNCLQNFIRKYLATEMNSRKLSPTLLKFISVSDEYAAQMQGAPQNRELLRNFNEMSTYRAKERLFVLIFASAESVFWDIL